MIENAAIDPARTYDYSGWTATDLAERFGSIPLLRVCMNPPPSSATEEDVVRLHDQTGRLFELVDGTLLEKTVGTYESYLAILIARVIGNFVAERKLGIVLGADGMLRMAPGLVRIPDVSFISKKRVPNGLDPNEPIANLVPDLAVEGISPGNTTKEMDRKLVEYFQNGVKLVWYVYPTEKRVDAFVSSEERTELMVDAVLNGGEVLPGFALSLSELFAKPF